MNNNHRLMSSDTSVSLSSSNTLPTSSHFLHPTLQSQIPATLHTPRFLSQLYNSSPTFQQHHQYTSSYQPQLQTLSQDEWDLILSFRMMKNLSVLPPCLPSSSPLFPHTGEIASCQSASSSDQTGNQIQSSRYYTTTATPQVPQYHSAVTTTASQHLSCSEQIQCTTAQIKQSVTTAATPPALSKTISTQQRPEQIPLSPQSPLGHQNHSPLPQLQSYSPPASPRSPLGHQNHSPLPQLQSYSPPASPRSPMTTALQPGSKQIQSNLQIYSLVPHSRSCSSSPASPRQAIISPAQQQQQNSSDTNLSSFPRQNHSLLSQASATCQYNATIAGPSVQLLDPIKPYEIGDKIKVGGRILNSDASSIKYWLEDDITVTKTATGGHMLIMAGYSYFAKNHGKNFTTWECDQRRRHKCSSIVIRSSDPNVKNYFRIYSIQGEHIHEPTPDHIEARTFKQRVRDRSRQELSSPRTIYEDELMRGKYSAKLLAVLPTFYNMIRKLPSSPTDPNFILHIGFTSTDKGERFLLYDSNDIQTPYAPSTPKVGRLIIYASDLQLDILSKSERIGSDGTFQTAPEISQQNYIIMGEFEEKHAVPLVYCLCERKNYETYKQIIQILKTAIAILKLNFNPAYWMSDYEEGLIKAIKKELPNTQLLGCAFHYHQAIYRNIQSKGLQDAYQNIEVVRQILREIMALAFLPSEDIRKVYYDVIKQQLGDVPPKPTSLRHNLCDFFEYYESYWLRKINTFCVFDQPTRTNNGLEGYNNKMSVQLSAQPHLYRLILWFEKEELLIQQLVTKVVSNIPVYKRKQAAITIHINNSLESLWKRYKDGTTSSKELLLESTKWVARKA